MKLTTLLILSALTLPLAYAQEEVLQVGLSGMHINPRIGIPLAGYGSGQRRLPKFIDWRMKYPDSTFFRPSEGEHSPIRAKTMAIKKGDRHLVFISLDTIGVESDFVKDLAQNIKRYGIDEKDIVIAATHTHGGPGTLSRRLPLEVIAVDMFKRRNYEHALKKVTESVEEALMNLEPAELFKSSAIMEGVQKNKWRRKTEEHFDKKATFVVARSKVDGSWLGGLVNFSIHGGTMPIGLLLYSSDVNGAIERKLEDILASKNLLTSRRPVFVFLNGAEGDVGGKGERSIENVEAQSDRFAEQAAPALLEQNLTKVKSEFFSVKKRIFVGMPGYPINKICGSGFAKKLPKWFRIGLYPLLPSTSYLSLAQLGDITFLSWPGEPSTQLGYNLQDMARKLGAVDPIVVSLANDYMTYFTTKAEYNEGAYDSCSTLYGWKSADRIINAHHKLMEEHATQINQLIK